MRSGGSTNYFPKFYRFSVLPFRAIEQRQVAQEEWRRMDDESKHGRLSMGAEPKLLPGDDSDPVVLGFWRGWADASGSDPMVLEPVRGSRLADSRVMVFDGGDECGSGSGRRRRTRVLAVCAPDDDQPSQASAAAAAAASAGGPRVVDVLENGSCEYELLLSVRC